MDRSRIDLLTRAIDGNPDAAINYVLRGELWLQYEEPDEAMADFASAIQLAQQEVEASDWGYLPQALLERARQGLKMAQALI